MKKFAFLCSMLLCTATLFPHNIYAKEIKSAAQAEKLAKQKVTSAIVGEVDIDYKNNSLVYEVDLYKGNREYQLTYKANNGQLIKYEWELQTVIPPRNKKLLTQKQIKSLASKKIKNSTVKTVHLDYDDGIPEYKVVLQKGQRQYKLVYHGQTGKLLEYEWEFKKQIKDSSYIGTAKAKKIALKKVPDATVIKAEFDMDDGVPVYELELVKNRMEYDIVIHAETGDILEFDMDD